MATTRQGFGKTVSTTTGFLEINDCAPSLASGQGQRNSHKKASKLVVQKVAVLLQMGRESTLYVPSRRN
jgi:hypothetical protein